MEGQVVTHFQIDGRGVHGGLISVGVMANGNIDAVAKFRRIFPPDTVVVSVRAIVPRRYRDARNY